MKKFKYYLLSGVGNKITPKEGGLKDLLLDIPFFISPETRLLPPLHVINDVLKTGIMDFGRIGGCKWEPFQIEEKDFIDLLKKLGTINDAIYKFVVPHDWVKNFSDWSIWKMEYCYGIPSGENKKLHSEYMKIEDSLQEAYNQNSHKLILKNFRKLQKIENKITKLILKYRNTNKGKK
jgi:hypothetical protein